MINKSVLKKLYLKKHQSMAEIAKQLNCSIHKVFYWMDKHGIKRRSWSLATYYKRNPNGHPFKIKKQLTRDDINLKHLVLGLYWGEGRKTNKHTLSIGNSDPHLLKHFQKFLLKVYQINPEKIKYYLQTFNDNDVQKCIDFWSSKLKIKPDKISCSKPIPSQGKGSYKRINKYGVLNVSITNIYLRKNFMSELKKLGYKKLSHIYKRPNYKLE
ncbi:hypothetical protein KJ953_03715 [Patescibacteria group bacterium]|nr:hypothetical protein [Patescibacteria group bacterium]MBU1256611.1 hypothetical protein [Patescibacteria group bacterium]MBU1457445.1 hypothetical protein [Patescibacteria group bacterium]